MKKHFTTQQIVWIVVICLIVEMITNFSGVIKAFKDGWNSVNTVAVK